ncbi:MAG: DEAD/DEAH box helicase, partial [Chloroflexi bacterium]|nr:DEAD/DEAH box helicase [Chloroflexota bacterium]
MTFTQFGLEPALLARLAARGYRQATALQLAALPVLLQGLPLLACGRPGSGHSEAFLLAALQRNAAQPVAGLQTVVVAASVHRAQMYARQMLALGGDALRAAILEEDGAGADAALLIVAPAQLQQLAQLLPTAPPLRMLVVDGLDALLRSDAAPALRTLLSQLPAGVQTALFCDEAVDAVLVLARTLHADAALLPVASDGPGSIPQRAWPVPRPLKMRLLMRMLKELDAARLLLIAPGGHMGIQFARKLRTRNVRASYLAADTSAAAAGEMLRSFQNGRLPVLIVPDQLPGELDASTITHLVNFDLPRQPAYLARLQAVPAAVVCSLVTPMEEQSLLDLEDKLGHPLWRDLVSDF